MPAKRQPPIRLNSDSAILVEMARGTFLSHIDTGDRAYWQLANQPEGTLVCGHTARKLLRQRDIQLSHTFHLDHMTITAYTLTPR